MRRDGEFPAASDLHARDAVVPPPDHPPRSQWEVERRTTVPGRVELFAGRECPARVVGADRAPGSRFVAAALDEVLDDEIGRRLLAGVVELRFAPVGIQWHRPSLPINRGPREVSERSGELRGVARRCARPSGAGTPRAAAALASPPSVGRSTPRFPEREGGTAPATRRAARTAPPGRRAGRPGSTR